MDAANLTAVRLSLRFFSGPGWTGSGLRLFSGEDFGGSSDTALAVSFQMVEELLHSQRRVNARLDSKISISISVRETAATA
jgi:hypothetical protein